MSLLAVSSKQNVDPQVVKDALPQDVTDGVITQAQSDSLTASLDAAVTGFVGNPLPMGQQATPAASS